MKFDVKRIVALVLTLALVVTTITFTAGNSLKANELDDQQLGPQTEQGEVSVSQPEEKADATVKESSGSTEEEEMMEEEAPAVQEQTLKIQENSKEHQIKLFVNDGVSISLSGFYLEGDHYYAQGGHFNTDSSSKEGLQGTRDIYDGNKNKLGTLTLVPHSGGNDKDAKSGTDNYDITNYSPVQPTPQKKFHLSVNVKSMWPTYNGQPYSSPATPSVAEGTTVYYSTDGGDSWSTDVPTITDVGTLNVMVKAENPNAENVAKNSYVIVVGPAVVVIKPAHSYVKEFGAENPVPEFVLLHAVGDDTIDMFDFNYKFVSIGAAYAITPYGENNQGNYYVKYETDLLNINNPPALQLSIAGGGYEGTYDGQEHGQNIKPTVTVWGNKKPVPENVNITYSTDGKNWVTEAPSIKDVGEKTVTVKAMYPEYRTETATYTLKVNPKPVTVKAEDKTKIKGENDPALTAKIDGLVEGESTDLIKYGIEREKGEAAKTYTITPSGDATQGNYAVSYETGTLTIMDKLALTSKPYNGTYDGQEHSGTVGPKDDAIQNIKYQYSLDGKNWTDTEPSFKDAGHHTYYVKGTAEGYGPSDAIEVKVNIAKKALKIVTPSDTKKYDGTALTNDGVKVDGLVEGEYFSIAVTGSQTEVGYSDNTVEYAFGTVENLKAAEAAKANYDISVELGVLTVTEADAEEPTPAPAPTPGDNGGNGGNNTVLVAQGTADDAAALTEVATERTPLASTLLDSHCCILHLLLMLAALIMLVWYTTDMKRRQRRIFELEEEINDKE